MKILPEEKLSELEPLSGSVGGLFVAGQTFVQARNAVFTSGEEISVVENAWISRFDAQQLEVSEHGRLVDTQGDLLASKGKADQNIIASKDSFLLCYSWQLLDVNAALLKEMQKSSGEGEISPAATIEGYVQVGAGTRILPGVFIEGNVIIGDNCKIGPNCYIRGATTIGDNCHVGQSVEIKNSILGHGTNVGHLSYVGDSILGEKVNFGAGTTTSNLRHDGKNHHSAIAGQLIDTGRRKFGTIVGDGVHTGIHTAIYPGRKFAKGSSTLPNATVSADVEVSPLSE